MNILLLTKKNAYRNIFRQNQLQRLKISVSGVIIILIEDLLQFSLMVVFNQIFNQQVGTGQWKISPYMNTFRIVFMIYSFILIGVQFLMMTKVFNKQRKLNMGTI